MNQYKQHCYKPKSDGIKPIFMALGGKNSPLRAGKTMAWKRELVPRRADHSASKDTHFEEQQDDFQ